MRIFEMFHGFPELFATLNECFAQIILYFRSDATSFLNFLYCYSKCYFPFFWTILYTLFRFLSFSLVCFYIHGILHRIARNLGGVKI